MTDVQSEGKAAKVVKKATDRFYYDPAGKDTNDLTEAVRGEVVYYDADKVTKLGTLSWEPITDDPTTRAMALFGFGTHAGNHRNKLVNTGELEGQDVIAGMQEYEQAILVEGGWTNRAGEATAGAGMFIAAYARYKNVDEAKVRLAWDSWTEEQREAVKKNKQIKALVDQIRAERSAAKAAEAEEQELPDLDEVLEGDVN